MMPSKDSETLADAANKEKQRGAPFNLHFATSFNAKNASRSNDVIWEKKEAEDNIIKRRKKSSAEKCVTSE